MAYGKDCPSLQHQLIVLLLLCVPLLVHDKTGWTPGKDMRRSRCLMLGLFFTSIATPDQGIRQLRLYVTVR